MASVRHLISLESLTGYARSRLAAAAARAARLDRAAIDLPGLRLTLAADDSALADLCRSRLAAPPAEAAGAAHARVVVLDATDPDVEPPALWDTTTGFSARAFDARLAAAGLRGFYHHDAPSWQFYDPAAGLGVYCLPSPLAIPPWERGAPLRLFMHWAYAASGRRLAHAATLGLDGRGVLLAGGSGSGKSGTTLAGILNGLTSAGDDYVLLDAAPGAPLVARAVFRAVKQDPAGLARVGLAADALPGGELNWAGKVEFDAAALVPGSIAPSLAIDAVVIPEIAGAGPTAIVPAAARDAALKLAPSAVFQLPGDADTGFRFYARVARDLPAFRARLGPDPVDIAATFRRLLTELRAHVR